MDDIRTAGLAAGVVVVGALIYWWRSSAEAKLPGSLTSKGQFRLPAVDLSQEDVRRERQRDFCRYSTY